MSEHQHGIEGRAGNYRFKKGPKGLFWFWWLVGSVAAIVLSLPWVWKHIHWRALLWSSLILVVILFVSETVALYYGWWIWNEELLLGPKVGLVPLEEFLLYFAVMPVMVILQTALQKILSKYWKR